MRAGGRFKHENCTDVAIEVVRVQFCDQKRVKLRVSWLNCVNPHNVYRIGITETIEIQRSDVGKWKPL